MSARLNLLVRCVECGKSFQPWDQNGCCCSRACAAKRTWKVAKPKHGMANKIPEYYVWKTMIQRCTNPKNPKFKNYGGRGISVCQEWQQFEAFFSYMGNRPTPQHSIHRMNNDGNYEPLNCEWATGSQQQRNKRNSRILEFDGRQMTVADWADELGVRADFLHCRLTRGWSVQRTLTEPAFFRGQS